MARKLLADRIAAHREKMARDKARLDQMQAREKKAERKLATRQKVLIGAAVVGELERDPEFRRRVMQLLHVALVRPVDREVLRHLLPEGSHSPVGKSDTPQDTDLRDAKGTLPAAAAEVGRPPVTTESILAELDAVLGPHGNPNRSPPPDAAADVDRRAG